MLESSGLSRWGRFKDPRQESDYEAFTFDDAKRTLQPILGMLTIVFALFLLPDVGANADNPMLPRILILRALVIGWLYAMMPLTRRCETTAQLNRLMLLSQVLLGIAFLYISSLYQDPDFMLQLLTMSLLMISYFVVPCRYLISLASGSAVWVFFLFLAFIRFPDAPLKHQMAAILFPLLFLFVTASFRLRIEKEQRRMYEVHQVLARRSREDPLTGAGNRYRFNLEMERLLRRAEENGHVFSVVMMDLDNFKAINDQHGHQAGDAVLAEVCESLRKQIREQDVLVRWGGEEFAVLLSGAGEEEALRITQRMREALNTGAFGPGLSLTGSFGLATWQKGDTAKQLVSRSDQLMYRAKANGKDRIEYVMVSGFGMNDLVS